MKFEISKEKLQKKEMKIVMDACALPGVKRVGGLIASDIQKVFGEEISLELIEATSAKVFQNLGGNILVATLGESEILKEFVADKRFAPEKIEGKREVYSFEMMETAEGSVLLIVGSDKRGTIYGMFHLSELLGVSPLVNWNQVLPLQKDAVEITDADVMVSKEPSVKYRGFFINDEWPAFGNWCNARFGGFNAECYAHVFELLLRLKGNYLWPAMWAAIFHNDGPDLANAQLADEMGVVMGMSHHEPCIRAGEEYKYVRGKDSIYGDAWDFHRNTEGITRFWEDSLKERGHFENVITVGMRGEFDSMIMGADATLKDNIDLLKDVLKCQNRLIREHVNEDLTKVPRMLALYKEVEPFYYGDENTEGLMDCEELEGVTLMLCDDNFGNLRTLPTEHMRTHNGGFGMYYHFDYHGSPISFEWVNSSYLPKVWEQMTTAYEFGIRDLWIVNVGDIFTTEYPLSFFLDLAYDYEKWGINNIQAPAEYAAKWSRMQFPALSEAQVKEVESLLTGYTKTAYLRRPEAMSADIFKSSYKEAQKHEQACKMLMERCKDLQKEIGTESAFPYFQFVYYPLMGNLNIHRMWCDTVRNHHLADMGASLALTYAEKVDEALQFDAELVEDLHSQENGYWYGMGMSEHIGFVNWNEEMCRYPILHTLKPANKKRLIVEVPETGCYTEGGPWARQTLTLDTLMDENVTATAIHFYAAGSEAISYSVEQIPEGLQIVEPKGSVDPYKECELQIALTKKYDRSKAQNFLIVSDNDSVICICIPAVYQTVCDNNAQNYAAWNGSYISMDAASYSQIQASADGAEFTVIPELGRCGNAIKCIPGTGMYTPGEGPVVEYQFELPEDGSYKMDLYMSPSNPAYMDQKLQFSYALNGEPATIRDAVPAGYKVGDGQAFWSQGVLNNTRLAQIEFTGKQGINTVSFQAITPCFVIHKLVVASMQKPILPSYLGPEYSVMK